MRKQKLEAILFVGLGIILLTGTYFILKKPPVYENNSSPSIDVSESTHLPENVPNQLTPSSKQLDAGKQADSEVSEAVMATRRMVLAHSSLRAPSVADPDSKENKVIMQAMIFKAISSNKKSADGPPKK